jgi:hypothetical protein
VQFARASKLQSGWAAAYWQEIHPPLRFGRSRRSHPGQPLARHSLENVAGAQTV